MRKASNIIYIAVILLMCTAPLLLSLAGINSPNLEKRVLSAAPALFSAQGKINDNYTADLDSYIADNFPLRTWLISAWHQINISLFSQTGNSQVILGRDGWLFFAESVPAYLGQDLMTDAEYARLDTILRLQSEYLASRGIGFLFTIAPDKNTVYPDLMPDRYTDRTAENALAGFSAKIGTPGYINLRDLLREAARRESQPLYHRSDSHWNNRGAFLAFSRILEQASRELGSEMATPFQAGDYVEKTDWQGDLAIMLYPAGPAPDIQQYFVVDQGYRYTRTLKSLEDMLITTKGKGEGSLLMFRDSFANALIPMLSESFASAAYSRALPYDYSLLDRNPADLVILEIVERNLRHWLSTPPKMPALAISDPEPAAVAAEQPELNLTADTDTGYLKISGLVSSRSINADWTRVLVSVGPTLYEAFPVTASEMAADTELSAGFVLHLAPGTWPAGPVQIKILIQTGSGWIAASQTANLP